MTETPTEQPSGTPVETNQAPPVPAAGAPRWRLAFALLALVVIALSVTSLSTGSSGRTHPAESFQLFLAWLSGAEGAGGFTSGELHVFELRFMRVLTAIGVGAALALSGALLQGVFRNDLASPSVLGLTTGASVGASLVLLLSGGLGPSGLPAGALTPWVLTASAFASALGVAVLVAAVASRGGRVSVATLLLVGIATNATLGGLLTLVQRLALEDFEVARALIVWSFGTIDDRLVSQVVSLFSVLGLCLFAVPFLATELDLFAGGEDDAAALGVHTTRVKLLALATASLAAAAAVAVSWQIGFIGLVVPHLLRRLVGRSHRVLLPACLLGGPCLLLGVDLLGRVAFARYDLPPGVLMSLIGGPFFFFLLLSSRDASRTF